MCDRVAIINKGQLVALDSTKNLIKKIKNKVVKFRLQKEINLDNFNQISVKVLEYSTNNLVLSYEKDKLNIGMIINFLHKNNAEIIDISTDDGDLEDVFVSLINR